MDNRDDILAKIKKLLDLAKSSNEHEAASALRQARKMMDIHTLIESLKAWVAR